ncbi:MAG: putative ABC transporter permease [Clostridia bacterium]|nr:putative ABC transporter permease [Clostridia bacterium]
MIIEIEQYIALFFIYSFAGWLMESVGESVKGFLGIAAEENTSKKRFVNRGFLIGPYCPIYGAGVLLITILLEKYNNDIWIIFFMSLLICGILEYMTSYLMEKLFKARWWDYSTKKFNINGRICLETLIPFGLAGTFIIYIANPFFLKYIEMLPNIVMHIFTISFLIIYITDMIISLKIILNLKEMSKEFKDNTIEISDKVRRIIKRKYVLYRRVVRAFPRIKENVLYDRWEDIKKKIEESKEEIMLKIDTSKEEIRSKIDTSKEEIRGIIDNSKEKAKRLHKKK